MDLDPFCADRHHAPARCAFSTCSCCTACCATARPTRREEIAAIVRNQQRVAARGREPGLRLDDGCAGGDAGRMGRARCSPSARRSPRRSTPRTARSAHRDALAARRRRARTIPPPRRRRACSRRWRATTATPMSASSSRSRSRTARRILDLPFAADVAARFAQLAEESLAEQREIEAADTLPFETFRAALPVAGQPQRLTPRRAMKRFETIVLGLGAMGSATAYQLARKGNRVLGHRPASRRRTYTVRRTATPASRGSAIGEGAQYTPLAMRSHEIWRELERETGTHAARRPTAASSCRARHEDVAKPRATNSSRTPSPPRRSTTFRTKSWMRRQIRRRFPQFSVADDESGYFEPERRIRAAGRMRSRAARAGRTVAARSCTGTNARRRSTLRTAASRSPPTATRMRPTRLIVTAGPWLPGTRRCVPLAGISRSTGRCCAGSTSTVRSTPFLPENFPVFIWELQGNRRGSTAFRPSMARAAASRSPPSSTTRTTTRRNGRAAGVRRRRCARCTTTMSRRTFPG